ncbi:putative DNA-binding domain-containing protein [Cribrihabitans neustonicus]|uniref:HvfC/BufC family peptide modification chaperone n=1 Tax=Cribrihabitans neustonicus TaxID=1429085 RepID=UPI003B5AE0AF
MSVSQFQFARALMDPGAPVPQGLLDHRARPAGRRFDVYRNNVTVSLIEALHSAFPVIAKLLGKENMDGIARLYVRAHPPASPLMMFYGAEFPAFLEAMPQVAHLGYLGDVARLELALRRAYHAVDADPILPETLGALAPEELMAAAMAFAPAVQVLRSRWPVFSIWRYNTEDGAPKPQPGGADVLITRAEFDPAPAQLPPGGAACVEALMAGKSLGAALDRGAAADAPGFDLGATLALLLQGGAITALNTSGETTEG